MGLPPGVSGSVRVRLGEGISGRVVATGRPVVVNTPGESPEGTLDSEELEGAPQFVSFPLLAPASEPDADPAALGVLNLTRRAGRGDFTSSDLKLIGSIAAYAATHIRNCRLLLAEREKMALERELEVAARIQTGLLPDATFRAADLTVCSHCRLARNVGGDYFDYWLVRPGTLGLVIADVSGHDLSAALLAASVRSTIRAQAARGLGVARTVASVNEVMFEDLCRVEKFLSLFYLEYDLETGHVDYCRAGHPMPLLLGVDTAEWLDTEGPLVGIFERSFYEQRSRVIGPGDLVVLYTDGLIEVGPDEAHLFGVDGLRRAAEAARGLPPDQIADRLVQSALGCLGPTPQVDDMAVVVIKRGDRPT
jgi:serine phosphatase RsbU (regulator of sigma subunit)